MRRVRLLNLDERGYGLISVLVAIVLLSAGVVVLSSSSVFLSTLKTESAVRSVAASIALAHMEEVKTRERAAIVSQAPEPVNERGLPDADGNFLRAMEVEPDADITDAIRLRVKVGYPGPFGRVKSIEVETVIYVGS